MPSANGNMIESLLDAIKHFDDETVAVHYVAAIRWGADDEQICQHCGSIAKHYWLSSRRVWKCRDCRKVFSVKVGTIFEGSPIPLGKWLPAMWMLANCKNGISSYELADDLDVTQKTAWFMLHRIRLAMSEGTIEKMDGEVEADESYFGGKSKNMHRERRERVISGTGGMGKVAVQGLLERHGPDGSRVHMAVVPNVRKGELQGRIREHVEPGAEVFTDALLSYRGLAADYVHGVIDHAESYARGKVHTNGLENFWSLVKRALNGTYISVEPFQLFRYLDEQAFRFNNRKATPHDRFRTVLSAIVGKRLTYDELTGGGRWRLA